MRESVAQSHEQSIHHRDIVQDYLDALLQEASLSAELEETVHAPATVIAKVIVAEPNVPKTVTPIYAVSAPVLSDPAEISVRTVSIPVPDDSSPAQATAVTRTRTTATEREVPEWGRQGFAALLFDVAGIKMAAPLHSLGGICLIEDNLQSVVAQADWFMGLLRWNDRNLRVIDTARFVMPERIKDNSHRAQYQSVIVLGNSHWALAVDQADESTHLASQDVRWKHLLGTRPWLAGTLLNRLCALVDVDSLTELLEEADHSSPSPEEQH